MEENNIQYLYKYLTFKNVLGILSLYYVYINALFTYEYFEYFQINYFVLASPSQIVGMLLFALVTISGKISLFIVAILYFVPIFVIVYYIEKLKFKKYRSIKRIIIQILIFFTIFGIATLGIYFYLNPNNLSYTEIIWNSRAGVKIINDYENSQGIASFLVFCILYIIAIFIIDESTKVKYIFVFSISIAFLIGINFMVISMAKEYAHINSKKLQGIEIKSSEEVIQTAIVGKASNFYITCDSTKTINMIPISQIVTIGTTHNK